MSARYAYWRNPIGGRYAGIDNKHAPTELLSQIVKQARLDKDGKVTWQAFGVIRFEDVVYNSVVVLDSEGREINPTDSRTIVRNAMIEIIKQGDGMPSDLPSALLAESDRRAARFYRKSVKNYALISTLTIKSFPGKSLTIDGCKVTPLKNRHRYPIPNVLKYDTDYQESAKRSKSQIIRVACCGRSVYEAASVAFDALGLLRGLWNLFAQFRSWNIGSWGRNQKPLGTIRSGIVHTLHDVGGSPVGDLFWYERHGHEDHDVFSPKNGWAIIEKNRRWSMRRIRQLPYSDDLRKIFIRYAAALDEPDSDVAFLRLWSILEALTCTSGARYDETIRRAAWIFDDRTVVKELLQYLRCYRNRYVHSDESGAERRNVAQTARSLIDPHLLALLRNDFDVQSLEEYGAILALPVSKKELEIRAQRLRKVLEVRDKWETQDE